MGAVKVPAAIARVMAIRSVIPSARERTPRIAPMAAARAVPSVAAVVVAAAVTAGAAAAGSAPRAERA